MPAESIMANAGLFTIIGLVSLASWATSGMTMPNFGALGPKGPCTKAAWAGIVGLLPFAIGCAIFADEFLEMFLPGVIGGLPDSARSTPMCMIILRRCGIMMFSNIITSVCIMSVGNEMTTCGEPASVAPGICMRRNTTPLPRTQPWPMPRLSPSANCTPTLLCCSRRRVGPCLVSTRVSPYPRKTGSFA